MFNSKKAKIEICEKLNSNAFKMVVYNSMDGITVVMYVHLPYRVWRSCFVFSQEIMHFQDETLYLAIHLLNRSLRLIKVTTANLQLLGMVCLFIAAKKEECLLPEVCCLSTPCLNRYSILGSLNKPWACSIQCNLACLHKYILCPLVFCD